MCYYDNMYVEHCFSRNNVLLITVVLAVEIKCAYDFGQEYTGVYFNPYVKHPYTIGDHMPYASNYTTEEIRVMLEVVTEKFSRVTTYGMGARNVSYQRNVTYYHQSDIEVFISEIAARLNRDRGSKRITILQGINYFDYNPNKKTEVQLAIESAEKANQIFPGTVEGFEFISPISKTTFKQAKETLEYLKELKNSSASHFKRGARMGFVLLYQYLTNQLEENGIQIVRDILQESHFVTCGISVDDKTKSKGVEVAYRVIDINLMNLRKHLQEIHELEVIGQLEWISHGYNKWDNLENLKAFWELADQWANKHKFSIRFVNSFDTPIYYDLAHVGWWKLADNYKSDQRDGYIEKVSELNAPSNFTTDNTSSTDTLIGAAATVGIVLGIAGLFIIMFIMVAITHLHLKKMLQKLSKEDIRLFRQGVTNITATPQDAGNIDILALRFPYNDFYEMQKDQIKIEYNKILGVGEFGCVFKATFKSRTGDCKDIALKKPKDGTPRSALKGMLSEIKILTYIGKHPNIVSLMGAYTAELQQGIVYIATELCETGSLQGYLRNYHKLPQSTGNYANVLVQSNSTNPSYVNDFECISLDQMVQWSLEIATGMEYLGSKNVVHADLATRNVLLSTERTAKICDFGLSRRMYNYTNYVKSGQGPMPWRWMAIESLRSNEFSAKSDVWSYGVTLWEIFSMGNIPYPGLTWSIEFANMLDDGLRLNNPRYATTELYKLMLDCWHMELDQRPSFTNIMTKLKNGVS